MNRVEGPIAPLRSNAAEDALIIRPDMEVAVRLLPPGGTVFLKTLINGGTLGAAVVFIHPAKPQLPIIEGIPGPIVDYPFDTTRTAVQLVLNGAVARSRRVRIILSHAGGFVPYAAHRFAELAPAVRPNVPPAPELIESFRSFISILPCPQVRRRFSRCRNSRGLDTSFTAVISPRR